MLVVKIIEINVFFKISVEDVVCSGLKKVFEMVKGIQGVWINEIKVVIDGDGIIIEWWVNLWVMFLVS